ncbi:target of Nesh-SH3 [Pleuronectes platessa]|uniref:target of Nesh-SH3 n=1 Tax=Pleuronectes platessa TaxID=8262 RepID=UPI00232A50C4|nr:target of Nesh-SH3 [Pleuronectes platessa]
MASLLLLLLLLVLMLLSGTPAQRVRAGRQNMRVRIKASGDTIVMQFVRSSPDVKLEGFILGYGSGLFSKQWIQLPEDGRAFEAEMDAEPKYLVAVQPIPVNDVKKHCTGQVNLDKALHLVIGSVSPTAVLLSWGHDLKTPYEGDVLNECLEDGFYTIRYRERNRKWNYQTCPTGDTVIDNLKPNTVYEFGVRSNKDERSGAWSQPVVHNMNNKNAQKTFQLRNPLVKPLKPHRAHALFPPRPALHNRTQPRLSPLKHPGFPGAPRTSFDDGNSVRNDTRRPTGPRPSVRLLPSTVDTTAAPLTRSPPHRDSPQNAQTPSSAPEKPRYPAENCSHDSFLFTLCFCVMVASGRSLLVRHKNNRIICKQSNVFSTGFICCGDSNKPLFILVDRSRTISYWDTRLCLVKPSFSLAAFSQSQDGSSLLRTALTNERARTNSWGNDDLVALPPSRSLSAVNLPPSCSPASSYTCSSVFVCSLSESHLIQHGRHVLHAAHNLTVMVASSHQNSGPSLPLPPNKPVARSSRPEPRTPPLPSSNGFRQPRPSSSSRTSSSSPTSGTLGVPGHRHRGMSPPKPALWHRHRLVNNSLLDDTSQLPDVFARSGPGVEEERFHGSPARPLNKRPNLVGKPGETDKVNDFKLTDKLQILKAKVPPASSKPERRPTTTTTTTATSRTRTRTTVAPTPATRQETWEDSDLFKSQPTSEIDAMGNKRFVAPHVVYQTGKRPDEPCSITSSLSYFPGHEHGEANATAPPKTPPSNLTVVTVEGCPSFIILDWEKTDNDTTEYEVISTAKGPDGEQVSILTTNQTHTAVENLKPESSYEFKVKAKNDLGSGPSSEPVSFNTESADPRVSENVSGKDAIWTQFPFKTDSYSDCHGKQYVKRTWYRKFVGVQLCNSLRYKIYLSDSLNGKFYNVGDQTGFGEDHCQFVDSFLDGRTGRQLRADQLPPRPGFYRAVRQEPVHFGQMGGHSHVSYVSWYECGTPIPGKW